MCCLIRMLRFLVNTADKLISLEFVILKWIWSINKIIVLSIDLWPHHLSLVLILLQQLILHLHLLLHLLDLQLHLIDCHYLLLAHLILKHWSLHPKILRLRHSFLVSHELTLVHSFIDLLTRRLYSLLIAFHRLAK